MGNTVREYNLFLAGKPTPLEPGTLILVQEVQGKPGEVTRIIGTVAEATRATVRTGPKFAPNENQQG